MSLTEDRASSLTDVGWAAVLTASHLPTTGLYAISHILRNCLVQGIFCRIAFITIAHYQEQAPFKSRNCQITRVLLNGSKL